MFWRGHALSRQTPTLELTMPYDFCPCDDIDDCHCEVEPETASETFERWSDRGDFDGPSDADPGL